MRPNISSALIVVLALQSSGQENVRQENRRFAIFLSYIFLSAGRNDDQVHFKGELLFASDGYERISCMRRILLLLIYIVLLACASSIQKMEKPPNELFQVKRVSDSKWGYIDRTGKVIIEPQFDRSLSERQQHQTRRLIDAQSHPAPAVNPFTLSPITLARAALNSR